MKKIKIFRVVKTVEFACHIYAASIKEAKQDAKMHTVDCYWDRTDKAIIITEVKES